MPHRRIVLASASPRRLELLLVAHLIEELEGRAVSAAQNGLPHGFAVGRPVELEIVDSLSHETVRQTLKKAA